MKIILRSLFVVCMLPIASLSLFAQGIPPMPPVRKAPIDRVPPSRMPVLEPLQQRSAGYEKDLVRLLEAIGSVTFLRSLCGEKDVAKWQEQVETLLDSEARDAQMRAYFVGAFNQGYRKYALTYRSCTAAARVVISSQLIEAETLRSAIAGRFGG